MLIPDHAFIIRKMFLACDTGNEHMTLLVNNCWI